MDQEYYYDGSTQIPSHRDDVFNSDNDELKHAENTYGDPFNDFIDTIKTKNYTMFSQLLRANPDFATRVEVLSKQPPIFYVVQNENEDMAIQMIKDLMFYGANPATKDTLKQNPMSYIARDGRSKLFDFMLSVKVPYNEIDEYKQTPLFYACREGRMDIVRKMIERGADPNHVDINLQTCLFYSAKNGHYEICKYLVENGAKHDHADSKKQTALAWAKKSKNLKLIEYFQSLKNTQKVTREKSVVSGGEPKVPQKRKGLKEREEPKNTYKLVFLGGGSRADVANDDFENFRRLHPDVAEFLLHPEKIPSDGREKKKDKWEKVAKKIIQTLWKAKGGYLFHEPVDPVKLNCLDYFMIIKNPMDFGTIKNRLQTQHYKKLQEFIEDVNLVFKNCILYNGTGSEVGKACLDVEREFQKLYADNNVALLLEDEKREENRTDFGDNESIQGFFPDFMDDGRDIFGVGGDHQMISEPRKRPSLCNNYGISYSGKQIK